MAKRRKAKPSDAVKGLTIESSGLGLPAPELCVYFVNSATPREEKSAKSSRANLGVVTEPIKGYDQFIRWLGERGGLVDSEVRAILRLSDEDPPGAIEALARVMELRDVLSRVVRALAAGKRPPKRDFETVQSVVREFLTPVDFVVAGAGGAWSWVPDDRPASFDRPRRQLAFSAAALLASDARRYVRECANKDCTVLFIGSNRTQRRWCLMGACGNLQKVRRYSRHVPPLGG